MILVAVRVAPLDCWSCKKAAALVSSVALTEGDETAECSIADFTEYPALVEMIGARLEGQMPADTIKVRYSDTMAKSYMSNGCSHCDALFGQHYEIHTRYDEWDAARFEADPAGEWGTFLNALLTSEDGHLFR